jgi:hypothetical protein
VSRNRLGHDGVRRWWQDLIEVFPEIAREVVEVRDLGEILTLVPHAPL